MIKLNYLFLGKIDAFGCEFDINELSAWYIQKRKKKNYQHMHKVTTVTTTLTFIVHNN